jgi:hypothetical protein
MWDKVRGREGLASFQVGFRHQQKAEAQARI